MVYNIEKMLKESGDKVQAGDKEAVEAALADAKKVLAENSKAAELKAALEKLTQSSHKLAEAMYKASSAQAAAGAPAGSEGHGEPAAEQKKDEGVIDAEYVDVDEKK
jgi:molecular chaperone DnaK